MMNCMQTITSRDGTIIAYETHGSGPALIIVPGALSVRNFASMPRLVELLAEHFTVFHYDRRGKGDSGDTKPYAVEREFEDLAALIDAAGAGPLSMATRPAGHWPFGQRHNPAARSKNSPSTKCPITMTRRRNLPGRTTLPG